ncbi:hypothetical protein BXZ70DRAFT_357158 [Cristinia sonorae]|uniref:Gamma-glutamylcyclotransferase AIG2-like domain-containing protein n=1 Tax=Cristinia sonorae TaxID=1940300 RepID=A0A8K0UJQ4_9AGAR|nr:hypothetical protein BXZ70DRAFT_357158 [Cristinia sonorae]
MPQDDDFFPDWSTDSEVPHATSLSERINLPTSIVVYTDDDSPLQAPFSSPEHKQSHFISDNRAPCLLFFYGTLSLPHVLQRVLGLYEAPMLLPASVSGFEVKMWGPYPALVRSGEGNLTKGSLRRESSSTSTPTTPTAIISSVTAKVRNRLSRGSSSPISTYAPPSPTLTTTSLPTTAEGEPKAVTGMAYWGTEGDLPTLLRYEGENYEMVECMIKSGNDEILGRMFVWCGYPEELSDEGKFDPTMFPENGT